MQGQQNQPPFAASGPFALDSEMRPLDPRQYRAGLLADPRRMRMVEQDEALHAIVQGDNLEAFATAVQAQASEFAATYDPSSALDKSFDALRAEATIPRDTVQVYRQLHDVGLQYGPAFRLLRNVHVPDEQDTKQNV